MNTEPNIIYEFGPFRIDPDRELLLRDGQPLAITPKVFEVLLALVRRGHEVVSKDELMQTVWPGRVVEEANLSQCIFVLRKLLGDTRDERRYIVTLPGQGYRFVERVRALTGGEPEAATPQGPPGIDDAALRPPAARNTRSTVRKLEFGIIGIVVVAIVLLVITTFVLHRDATSTANTGDAKIIATTLANVPTKSVAVLPLTNESGDPKQQYFSDGLSEELISDLAQIKGLKVIGKYSSFRFRDSNDSPAQIGATLGASYLIQGSVRQQGYTLRVMVTLIGAKDGAVVWSHSYDEQLKDVFAIQTKIGDAVAAALQIQLLGKSIASGDKPPSDDVEAYQLMLQGRALARLGTEAGFRQSIALYQQALKLDPNYAYAWGTLSNASVNLGTSLTGDAQQQAYAQARAAQDRQQLLAPDEAHTHMERGYLLRVVDNDPVGALAEFKQAYALAPDDGTVMDFLALGLESLGQLQPAVEMFRKAIASDPLRPFFYANLAGTLLAQGQLDAAEQAMRKGLALQPDFPGLHVLLAVVAVLRGDAIAAMRDAKLATDPAGGRWIRAMAQQIGPNHKQAEASLHDYIAKYGNDQPYNVAELYALRKQPEAMFEWLERAWSQHDPGLIGNLLSDPFVLPYRHDPRFAALCRQAGLPLPGQVLPGDAVPASTATP